MEFFFDVIIAFLNDVKLKRIEKYNSNGILSIVDSDLFD